MNFVHNFDGFLYPLPFLYEYPNIYIVEQKNLCSTAHYNLFEKIAYISRYSRFFVFICIWIKKIPLDYEQALIY